MKSNHVWVIEMLLDGKWLTCKDCEFTRKAAQSMKNYKWKKHNPDDKFRVWKYQAVPTYIKK